MFGFIHESFRQLVLKNHGEEIWKEILDHAGFKAGTENIINHYYPDVDTFAIAGAAVIILKVSPEVLWEAYGYFIIAYTMDNGWDELLRGLSHDLKGFLDNLDALHYFIDHVVYKANLRGPTFRCEDNDDGSITLHYFTGRPGLYPIVIGVVKALGEKIFNIDVDIALTGRTQKVVMMNTGEKTEEHVTFSIKIVENRRGSSRTSSALASPMFRRAFHGRLRLTQQDFVGTFPYNFVFDEDCKFVMVGCELAHYVAPQLIGPGLPINRAFDLNRPQIPIDFESFCNFINSIFVLQVKTTNIDYNRRRDGSTTSDNLQMLNGDMNGPANQHLKLKGQMMLLKSGRHIMYLCSPYVTSIPELIQYGLHLESVPLHDTTRDLILLNQQRLSDVEMNMQLEEHNAQLEKMAKDLEKEKSKADLLLCQMLPDSVAQQLKTGQSVEAKEYAIATIMFTDIPSFQTIILPSSTPRDIVTLLNELFTKFDRLVELQQAHKMETIGDSYMSVGGVPEPSDDHCVKICHLALGMLYEATTVRDRVQGRPVAIRAGIHSGPVVAGVVGAKMPRYCLFGDTVNTASRMESHSPVGRIHCSEVAVRCAIESGRFEFLPRGRVQIKGKGEMTTFYLLRSFSKSMWEITGRERDENENSITGFDELLELFGLPSEALREPRSDICTIQ